MTNNIIIVDSDQIFSCMTAEVLMNSGHKVEQAFTEDEGIEMLAKEVFDLVIINFQMVDSNGLDFIGRWEEEIKAESVPIIFTVPQATDKTTFDALMAKSKFGPRIVEVLFKPIAPSQLKSFIDVYFESQKFSPTFKPKVMAVDDSDIIVKMYQSFFEKFEFEYQLTTDPSEAGGIAKYFKPDLILMDASMPEIDGFMLTKEIKATPALESTLVIMVTADSRKETVLKVLQNGAIYILHKPFDEEFLVAKMNAHLESKRQFDEITGAYKRVKTILVDLEAVSSPIT